MIPSINKRYLDARLLLAQVDSGRVRRDMDNWARSQYGECKRCTHCKNLRGVFHFEESSNSDDGLFPLCRQCVAKMETAHAKNYQRYFPNTMEQ